MSDSGNPREPQDGEHPLDSLLSGEHRRVVLWLYAALLFVVGIRLLLE